MSTEPTKVASWKVSDFWYGALGLVIGFFITFSITNAVQRDELGQAGTATARQTRDLPPDHPPINADGSSQAGAAGQTLPEGHPPIAGSAAGSAAGSTTAASTPPPPLPSLEPRPGPGPKAEDQFKDIQVLKGVPPTDFQTIMGIITVSLGVTCDYCHVPGAFEKPHPMKDVSRKWIQLVKQTNQMNKDVPGGQINCYTCHRGLPKPPPH